MWFSKRNGYSPAKKAIQRESLDAETRNRLWNVILLLFLDRILVDQRRVINIYRAIWTDFFKQTIDTVPALPNRAYTTSDTKKFFAYYRDFFCSSAKWHECFDFLEFIVEYARANHLVIYQFKGDPSKVNADDIIALQSHKESEEFENQFTTFDEDWRGISFARVITAQVNRILEEETSAYRFLNGHITEITSEIELQEIDEAIAQSNDPIQEHLKKALNLLSDRKNPDYQNSVKESISAVESLCRIVTGSKNAQLGDAIKAVERKYSLHHALREAFQKLYGYTSDAGGIRHGSIDFTDVDYDLAKYMLVSCSAFINYLRVICKNN